MAPYTVHHYSYVFLKSYLNSHPTFVIKLMFSNLFRSFIYVFAKENMRPYVVETVSICEETRIKFSSASGIYLGTTLSSTCFKSEYKRVFPLKRPLDRRFAPISVWNSSNWTSTSHWAVVFIFSATAYTYYHGHVKMDRTIKQNFPQKFLVSVMFVIMLL